MIHRPLQPIEYKREPNRAWGEWRRYSATLSPRATSPKSGFQIFYPSRAKDRALSFSPRTPAQPKEPSVGPARRKANPRTEI